MSISISFTAARTSGVAPLYVFCDATATTSTTTSHPYNDLLYKWDFGDTGAGTWSIGARTGLSKNAAWGPVAGHIFETPGTYTITLHVYDGVDTASTTASITVTDPDSVYSGTNTICVSTSGNFTGAPAGSSHVTSSDFDASLSSNGGTGKRVLYCRGETFTASTTTQFTVTGPGTIGAYGSGALPQVNSSGAFGDAPIIEFGSSSTVNQKDWRVMDLSFNGNGSAECIGMGGGFDQVTLLRLTGTNTGDAGIFFNSATLNVGANPHLFEQAAIHECTISDPSTWCVFFNAKNFSVQGCDLDNAGSGSHTLRISIGINGVVSNNDLGPNGPGAAGTLVLKIHGAPWGSATDGVPINTATTNIVVANNKFTPGNAATNNWTVALEPQDSSENEHLTNFIVEDNHWVGGTNTAFALKIQGIDFTVRNNLCNSSGAGAGGTFVEVDKESSGAPAPDRVGIFNNTCYTSANNLDGATPFISITSTVVSSGATIRNNLGYAPSAGAATMIVNGTTIVSSNNSTNAQVRSTNPNFVSGSPSAYADFAIQTTSYAKAGGTNITNYYDGFDRSRVGVTNDMGFYQYNLGSDPFGGGGGSTVVIPSTQPRMVFHLP